VGKDKDRDQTGAALRIAIREAKAAERAALCERFGVKDFAELDAKLKPGGAPAAPGVQDGQGQPVKTYTQAEYEQAVADVEMRRKVERELLAAGVKAAELDYAVHRFIQKVADMDESVLKTYEVGAFVRDLPGHLFTSGKAPDAAAGGGGGNGAGAGAGDAAAQAAAAKAKADADAAAAEAARKAATTGQGGSPPAGEPGKVEVKDWSKAPRAERDARVTAILDGKVA